MAEDKLAVEIIRRQSLLEEIRSPWELIWQDIADHLIPIREDIRQEKQEGERRGTKIYDGTPLSALQLFADGLHGYMISPSFVWFRLKMGTPIWKAGGQGRGILKTHLGNFERMDEVPEVKAWLQESEKCLYEAYQRSTFYYAMSSFFEDGGSIGTAVSYSEEDIKTGRIVFTTVHPGECYIAENRFGDVDVVHRKVKLEARKAVERFGLGKVSDRVRQAAEGTNPFQKFEFIHAVYPRTDRVPGRKDAENKPWASVWVEKAVSRCAKVSGYNLMPYTVWRYKKSTGETYGRSPAMFALADVMGIHQISRTLLGAAHRVADPAYNVPSELQGKVRLRPGEYNYYGKDHQRVITPVMTGIQYPIAQDREAQKRKAIEEHFHVDFFLMLTRAPRQMTATEILERQAEKAAILSAPIGRLTSETLNPTMDRVFEIELEAGRLPPVPEILLEMAGEPIDTDFMGPLAQAQRRLFRTQSVVQGLEAVGPLSQMYPQVADLIDPDTVALELLESNGFPQKAIRDPKQVKELREARAQAMEEEKQAQAMAQAGQGGGGGAGGLEEILGQAAGMEEGGPA